jgi:3-dehydroquinate synthase
MSDRVRNVRVQLAQRSYDISIGQGLMDAAGIFLRERSRSTHAAIITDEHVARLYARRFVASLEQAAFRADVLTVSAGEPSKSIQAAATLWAQLLDRSTDRASIVVALGGGVVGDLAGFVAATFARGVSYFHVPTTLLAQVDSSVGGKVGVNLPGAKNIVGAFWQPLGVLIDPTVLETLAEREYRAGLAEVVKYGVILDADFFAYLESHAEGLVRRDAGILGQVISRCCQLKSDVVGQDEREESGLRSVLNYGHTFCHALEAATGYQELLHGEAVAMGMLCASRLAERLGRVSTEVTRRQHDLLDRLGLPTRTPELPSARLLELMHHDKKAERGRLRFVLPARIGHVELVSDVDEKDVLWALDRA